MKRISALLVLTLMSSFAYAESNDFQYANYKEMYFHDLDSGTYSFTVKCTDNTLQWNKKEKKYTRSITKTTTKGFDIIQHNGDSVKVTSNSVDSDGTKYFSEHETTFLTENNYIRHNKSRTVNPDGSEYKSDRVIEGVYLEGKFNTTKIISNGVETPVKKSTFISVTNDAQYNSFSDSYTYEPADIKEQMQNESIESLTVRIDTVCNTEAVKL